MTQNIDNGTLRAIEALVGTLQTGALRDRLESALTGQPGKRDELKQQVLSTREAALVLGVSRRTVLNFSKRGFLKRVLVPGATRGIGFTRSSVEALVGGGA